MRCIATLKAVVTADGIAEVNDNVKVGDTYFVETKTISEMDWGRTDQPGIFTKRISIYAEASKTGDSGWFPLELLDVEGMSA